MTKPEQIMVEATLDALRPHVEHLRHDGWPCETQVDHVELTDSYVVSLRIAVPFYPKPVEAALATAEQTQDREPS